jgi:hypothetical protein
VPGWGFPRKGIALGALIVLVACEPASQSPVASHPVVPAPAPVLDAGVRVPAPASVNTHPRLDDPRWLAARSDDPLEKARLAEAVGAAELLAGIGDGGETAETALAALPFADDAEIALGPLADRIATPEATDGALRHRLLSVILAVAGQPRRQREPLDPEGARRCGQVLLRLAADTSLPREDRALAVSAARALAERRYVDPARIPSDLDPKSR